MATLDAQDLAAIGSLLDRKLKPLARAVTTLSRKVRHVDAAAAELQAEIATLNTEESETHQAVADAGAKFVSLQQTIEGLRANQPLTDAEIQTLKEEAAAISGHLVEATGSLKTDTAAATG